MPGGGVSEQSTESVHRSAIDRGVEQYLQHIAVERGLSSNTQSAYRRDLARYVRYLHTLGAVSPEQVTKEAVAGYSQWLHRDAEGAGAQLKAGSVTRMLSAVRSLHKFWFLEGLCATDLSRAVVPPKLPKRLPKALTIGQVELLLGIFVADDPLAIRNRALLEFMYATGARVSEAIAVTVDQVFDTDLVRLIGKGDKERIVPLGSYARAALDEYLVRVRPALATRGRGTPALFLSYRGSPLTRQSAWEILSEAAEKAGLSAHVSPHTLRHSFATHLLSGGADIRVVQELLGHSSVSTTQIYTLVTNDALREVYATSHPRAR